MAYTLDGSNSMGGVRSHACSSLLYRCKKKKNTTLAHTTLVHAN